jgi:hypothetical protein
MRCACVHWGASYRVDNRTIEQCHACGTTRERSGWRHADAAGGHVQIDPAVSGDYIADNTPRLGPMTD